MNRISILDTNTCIILYDDIYNDWHTTTTSQPIHISQLLQFFISFTKTIHSGNIQRVVFNSNYDSNYKDKHNSNANDKPKERVSAPIQHKSQHNNNNNNNNQSKSRNMEMCILIHSDITVCIFTNPAVYNNSKHVDHILHTLYNSFITEYKSILLQQYNTLQQLSNSKQQDDILNNTSFLSLFESFDEHIKMLNLFDTTANQHIHTPPHTQPIQSNNSNNNTFMSPNKTYINNNNDSILAQQRSRANTLADNDNMINNNNNNNNINILTSSQRHNRLLRQSQQFTDIDDLNLDLANDYNDISVTNNIHEQSVNSSTKLHTNHNSTKTTLLNNTHSLHYNV